MSYNDIHFYTLEESLINEPICKKNELEYLNTSLCVAKKRLDQGYNIEYWKYLIDKLVERIHIVSEMSENDFLKIC